MIANWSRLSQFSECHRFEFNWDELRLMPWREDDNLLTGGGFHVGAATLFATKDPQAAADEVERSMRARYAEQTILPEERPLVEHAIEWAKRAVLKFAEYYEGVDIQVLWPEVEFCIPIPNSWHHCFFAHRLLHPDVPFYKCLGQVYMDSWLAQGRPHISIPSPCTCVMPHYFKGKTDAVVQWQTKMWLFEHKTNKQAREIFYKGFILDEQTTGYLYGIWKTLGVLPAGFILNVIQKPQKNSRDQLQVGFGREVYIRSEEDLMRFERQFVSKATDYENTFRRQIMGEDPFAAYMNSRSCTNYSRECQYMSYCGRHFEALEGEFRPRAYDYVELEYYKLLGLQSPQTEPIEGEQSHEPAER